MEKLAFIGAGSHSDAVLPVVDLTKYEFVGYFDDKDWTERNGYPILGKIAEAAAFLKTGEIDAIFITIGDNRKRQEVFHTLKSKYYDKFINIISKSAHLFTEDSVAGKGIFIGYSAFIGSKVKIHDNTIVNTGAVVEHHTTVASHCNISPNATINGFSVIETGSYIGSGSVVIQLMKVASWSIIGAGAVVVKPIEQSGTYVGTPARKVK